jgi:hypothetical protein
MEQACEMLVNIATGEIIELLALDLVTTLSAISRYKQSVGKKYMKHLVKTLANILLAGAISYVQSCTQSHSSTAPSVAINPD